MEDPSVEPQLTVNITPNYHCTSCYPHSTNIPRGVLFQFQGRPDPAHDAHCSRGKVRDTNKQQLKQKHKLPGCRQPPDSPQPKVSFVYCRYGWFHHHPCFRRGPWSLSSCIFMGSVTIFFIVQTRALLEWAKMLWITLLGQQVWTKTGKLRRVFYLLRNWEGAGTT